MYKNTKQLMVINVYYNYISQPHAYMSDFLWTN